MAGCGEESAQSTDSQGRTVLRNTCPEADQTARASPQPGVLFRNVRTFNGIDPVLQTASNVLVRGNRIVSGPITGVSARGLLRFREEGKARAEAGEKLEAAMGNTTYASTMH